MVFDLVMMFKEFLIERIPLKNRGLFYLLCQNNLKLNELEVVLKDHFQMQEQTISALLNQLSSISTASEAEARVKEKIYNYCIILPAEGSRLACPHHSAE